MYALFLLLQAAAPTPASPARPDLEVERAIAALVDPARAQMRVRELVALGPRMGGTRSGDAAAAYRARAFADLGLDARVVDDPERDAYQPLSWRVVARRRSEPVAELALDRAWPWFGSASGRGTLALSLVAGEGAALLTAKPPGGVPQPPLILITGSTNLDGSYPIVHSLKDGARGAWFGISTAEGRALAGWLDAGAAVEVEYSLEAESRRAPVKTVVARLAGAGDAGEPWTADYLLFCAHGDSDSGGPGADDNASGEATLLEIAAAWKRAVDARLTAPPAREVRFAIWGSEIFSTREYLKRRVPAEGALLGVINYDQAGFGSGADQLNVEPDDLAANAELVRALCGVLRDHAPAEATKPGDFPARWATNKSLGGTDSYVFSNSKYFREGARPAVTVFTSAWGEPAEHAKTAGQAGESWSDRDVVSVDFDLYYHSAGDTPENTTDLEPWNMAWCARVGLLGARRFLAGLDRGEASK